VRKLPTASGSGYIKRVGPAFHVGSPGSTSFKNNIDPDVDEQEVLNALNSQSQNTIKRTIRIARRIKTVV
jgi:hypothetical protein